MSSNQIVLADIDGTLVLPTQNGVSKRVRAAILRCEGRGIKVCTVTGRPYGMAQPVLSALSLQYPCVFDGGATIADPKTGKILWSCWIKPEQIKQIVQILLPHILEIDYDPTYNVRLFGDVAVDEITESSAGVWAAVHTPDAPGLVEQL